MPRPFAGDGTLPAYPEVGADGRRHGEGDRAHLPGPTAVEREVWAPGRRLRRLRQPVGQVAKGRQLAVGARRRTLLAREILPNLTGPIAHLRDFCAADALTEAKVEISIFAGFLITIPRRAHEAFGKGKTLAAPQAQTYFSSGDYPVMVNAPVFDTTKVGKDYKLKK